MRVHQQAAYILVNRPYSETSWIVEVFSRDYGRLSLMAKGARRFKSKLRGTLLPFQPTLLSWTGKGEMPTLTSAEIDQRNFNLIEHELLSDARVCGFYCNELLNRLMHRHDPHPQLFDRYDTVMMALARAREDYQLAEILRKFERTVMKETGYEVSFQLEADGKTPIDEFAEYRFQPGQGFVRVSQAEYNSTSGRIILLIGSNQGIRLSNEEASSEKRLMRDILRHSLGRNEIVSRALFYPRSRPH